MVFGTLDCATTSRILYKANSMAKAMFCCSTVNAPDTSRRQRHDQYSSISKSRSHRAQDYPPQQFENTFIRALVQAGRCQKHSGQSYDTLRPLIPRHDARRELEKSIRPSTRLFSSKTENQQITQAAGYTVTRKELHGLVDYYSLRSPDDQGSPMSSNFEVGDGTHDMADQSIANHTLDPKDVLIKLKELLEDEETPHEYLYATYQALPHPRASYVSEKVMHILLQHLSVVEYKSEASMLRYLAVVEDIKAAGLALTVSEWTSAIAFAGRCLKKISSTEVESALSLWKEMENEAGIRGNNVTFNVLFDIATKAGKFVLAEMIMKEMESRNLEFNRYFRTGLIYHYGLRADGDGVRKAYRDLVDAEEIVDTTVITCVVASLLKCGEAVAAEQVFERAKRLHVEKANLPLPPQHWRRRRELGRMLDRAAQELRAMHDLELRQETRRKVQDTVSLAPHIKTYKVLVYYHAVVSGDIDRVTELVDEMEFWDIRLHGSIFLYLFKGFSIHGGALYTSWTRRRLENTWAAYIKAVDLLTPDVYISRSAAVLALRAYSKCAGHERMLQIWEAIKNKWKPDEDDEMYVHEVLQHLQGDAFAKYQMYV